MKYVLSIDQGTSSTRAMIFDESADVVGSHQIEHKQFYPQNAWVEHDPEEIWNNTKLAIAKSLEMAKLDVSDLSSIGITNQRETVVAWEKSTGNPLYNAIVWQCRRTAPRVAELEEYKELFKEKTGLILDAYFSGTKIEWLLNNVSKVRDEANSGNLAFGTIDSWINFKMTGKHRTDSSNASRTLLYNIRTGEWDEELATILSVPMETLPEVVSNKADGFGSFNGIPVSGILGDQQAALFGQLCFNKGEIKNTYGTGNFTLLNTGTKIVDSNNGLLSTVAWEIGGEKTYALEGSVFVTGAALQWLRSGLALFESYDEIDDLIAHKHQTDVYFVPAFVGLGAPYWDSSARGTIIGLTGGTDKSDLVRATIEAIGYQTEELVQTMKQDSNLDIRSLRVDGGSTKSNALMQFQADISQISIEIPRMQETTAMGAALIAGLGHVWESIEDMKHLNPSVRTYQPIMNGDKAALMLGRWKDAVQRSRGWSEP